MGEVILAVKSEVDVISFKSAFSFTPTAKDLISKFVCMLFQEFYLVQNNLLEHFDKAETLPKKEMR